MSRLADLKRDYKTGLLRYLVRTDEAPLHTAYVIGRSAVTERLSILDLSRIHHEVLIEILQDTAREDLERIATSASQFFGEALSTYDMTQRSFLSGS
jgi:Phosphoserine phosphatase RsbU, N-terminal domain